MNAQPIIISVPTYGATAAATYLFMTSDYKPPQAERALEFDVVVNQNGKFKWLYDNGPGFKKWSPFTIRCEDVFKPLVKGLSATQQYAALQHAWAHPGLLGLAAPDGTYSVHWSQGALEPELRQYPVQTGDPIEFSVTVQFEEAI
jgi:hypothetical protein